MQQTKKLSQLKKELQGSNFLLFYVNNIETI